METENNLTMVINSIFAMLGILLNLIICVVVGKRVTAGPNLTLANQGNMFHERLTLNLGASNLYFCILCMPITFMATISKPVPVNNLMCSVLVGLQQTMVIASSGTAAVIAYERCRSVTGMATTVRNPILLQLVAPHKCRLICILVIVWLVAVTVSFPISFLQEQSSSYRCAVNWPNNTTRIVFSTVLTCVQCFIPMTVITISNARVCIFLFGRREMRYLPASQQERNRRTIFILTAITVTFAITWIPINLVTLMVEVFNWYTAQEMQTLIKISTILSMTSTCTNPVLYGWCQSDFKGELICMLTDVLNILMNLYHGCTGFLFRLVRCCLCCRSFRHCSQLHHAQQDFTPGAVLNHTDSLYQENWDSLMDRNATDHEFIELTAMSVSTPVPFNLHPVVSCMIESNEPVVEEVSQFLTILDPTMYSPSTSTDPNCMYTAHPRSNLSIGSDEMITYF